MKAVMLDEGEDACHGCVADFAIDLAAFCIMTRPDVVAAFGDTAEDTLDPEKFDA